MSNLTWNLSLDDATAVISALNEVCHGVHIEDWEFETRLGVDRKELQRILADLHRILASQRPR